jgi:hypothetical protein
MVEHVAGAVVLGQEDFDVASEIGIGGADL